MLFHQVQADLEISAVILDGISAMLDGITTTRVEDIRLLMDHIERQNMLTRYRVFKKANWVSNSALYEACEKYELERFTKLSNELRTFIENTMVNFVKKHPIYKGSGDSFYLGEALDAIEVAFWLGISEEEF